eukprot:UN01144
MALYQPVTQHPQVMQQPQQYAMYMNNQGNANWNWIQYQQLLYAQQLYPFPATILVIPQQQNTTNGLSLNASVIGAENTKQDELIDSPLNIDSMSPSIISSLLNAPEFIPSPKSCDNDNQDTGKLKALNANCAEFLPGVTSWKKSTQLSAIQEDEYDDQPE